MSARPEVGGSSQLPRVVFQLPPGGVEGVAQGNVGILVLLPVHHDFFSGHAQVDVDVERLALLLMFCRLFDHDAATDDVGEKLFEFLGLLADVRLECVGGGMSRKVI